jgi:hypothetical protein
VNDLVFSSAGTRRASELDRLLAPATLAGMAAGGAAATVGMVGTWIAGSGFFTPLYGVMHTLSPMHVANAVVHARSGDPFYAVRNPMIGGGATMLMVSGVLGMVFLAAARRVSPRWPVTLTVGVLFSLAVLALLTLSGLSNDSRLVAGSQPVSDLSAAAGWAVLLAEYLTFGLVLGAWAGWRPQDLRPQGALDRGGLRAPAPQADTPDGDEGRAQ